jgi:hypothetical protein
VATNGLHFAIHHFCPIHSRHRTLVPDLVFDANGDTILASASLNAIPQCAALSAPQSFPPSPQNPGGNTHQHCLLTTGLWP